MTTFYYAIIKMPSLHNPVSDPCTSGMVVHGSFVSNNHLYFISLLFKDVGVNKGTESVAQSVDELGANIWLEKAEVFMSIGLYEPARQSLAEAHRVSVVRQ